jgi:hypothetical protein
MSDCPVTYKDLFDAIDKLRGQVLTELRLQRADHIAPLTAWQHYHEIQHDQERDQHQEQRDEHQDFHRQEKHTAWKAASAIGTLLVALAGLTVAIAERLF